MNNIDNIIIENKNKNKYKYYLEINPKYINEIKYYYNKDLINSNKNYIKSLKNNKDFINKVYL